MSHVLVTHISSKAKSVILNIFEFSNIRDSLGARCCVSPASVCQVRLHTPVASSSAWRRAKQVEKGVVLVGRRLGTELSMMFPARWRHRRCSAVFIFVHSHLPHDLGLVLRLPLLVGLLDRNGVALAIELSAASEASGGMVALVYCIVRRQNLNPSSPPASWPRSQPAGHRDCARPWLSNPGPFGT